MQFDQVNVMITAVLNKWHTLHRHELHYELGVLEPCHGNSPCFQLHSVISTANRQQPQQLTEQFAHTGAGNSAENSIHLLIQGGDALQGASHHLLVQFFLMHQRP